MGFSVPAVPNTFADGNTISAAPFNANFAALVANLQHYGEFVVDNYTNATDSAKLAAAIADANTNGGGIIVLEPRTYQLATTWSFNGNNIVGRGASPGFKRSSYNGGTRLQIASGVTGSGVSFTGNNCGLQNCYISNNTGSSTVPAIAVGAVQGNYLTDIFVYNSGGITHTGSSGAYIDRVICQNYNGNYGFYSSGAQIIEYNACNAAANTSTSPNANNWYHTGGETVIMNDCEGNNNVGGYQLALINTSDSDFKNFQANGGTSSATQVYISGCTDIDFDYLYILQPAALGLNIVNSQIISFTRGWIGNQTQQALIDGGSGQVHDLNMTGLKFQQSTVSGNLSTAPLLTFQGSCHNYNVVACTFDGGNLNYNPIADNSNDNGRSACFVGNSMENFPAGYKSILRPTYSPNAVYMPNAGTGEPGRYMGTGAPTISASLGSDYVRLDGTSGSLRYVNTNGGTGWTPYA